MKIGIIGTGNMGRALGLVWAERGHDVLFGARNPAQSQAAVAFASGLGAQARVQAGSNDEAARFGEVLLYSARAVPPAEVLGDPGVLAGKIVVDMNNGELPRDRAYPANNLSHAEALAGGVPEAHVVKAFNTLPAGAFELCPDAIRPYRVSCFIAGDNVAARRTVAGLAEEIGFVPVDCGPLLHARVLEGIADYIRMMLSIKQDMPNATFSLANIPEVESPRLGGQQPSRFA
jgi:8-hydroxy-5-deazaflavin:NADPH oxidoreductase